MRAASFYSTSVGLLLAGECLDGHGNVLDDIDFKQKLLITKNNTILLFNWPGTRKAFGVVPSHSALDVCI